MNSSFAFKRCISMAVLSAMTIPTLIWGGTQTWISGTGTDGSGCTVSSPCATFQGVLNPIFSPNSTGEIDALDSGVYGGFTIYQPKSVTIDGGAGNIASIFQDFISISGLTADEVVILRNLTLNGSTDTPGPAIQFVGPGTLIIESCKIYGYSSTAVVISGATSLIMKDTVIESNGGDAIEINLGGIASLSNLSLKDNAGNGLTIETGSIVDISDSVITQNTGAAISVNSIGSTVNCMNNVITSNAIAIQVGLEAVILISNNDIYSNGAFIEYGEGGGNVMTANNNRTGNNGSTPSSPTSSIVIQ